MVEDDPRAVKFVLVKDGAVYRMQCVKAMEEMYQEMILKQKNGQ